MAKLLLMEGGAVLRDVDLTKARTTIGRRPFNDVVLDDLNVSGEHAVVTRRGDDFYLEDVGSTNGTLVNGDPITTHVLRSGDCIEIAKCELRFVDDGATSAMPMGAPDRPDDVSAGTGPVLRILSGADTGRELPLRKALTRIGRSGYQVIVVTRRPAGYFISHVEGDVFPTVNGVSVGSVARLLLSDDIVEVAGVTLQFVDRRQSAAGELAGGID